MLKVTFQHNFLKLMILYDKILYNIIYCVLVNKYKYVNLYEHL